MEPLETLLQLARQQLGVRESPPGSNRVKYNTAYYGREVSGAAYPWCCVFQWWLFREAGLSGLFYGGGRTASCGTLAAWARARGRFVSGDFRPGDLVFLGFTGDGTIQHIGLAESVRPGEVTTIEGNTGAGSDANGGEVQRRVRPVRLIRGAYRPAYEEGDSVTQQQFDEMMDAWLRRRAAQEPSAFSAQARAWAEKAGIFQGGAGGPAYRSFCTREQALVFLQRLAETLGK